MRPPTSTVAEDMPPDEPTYSMVILALAPPPSALPTVSPTAAGPDPASLSSLSLASCRCPGSPLAGADDGAPPLARFDQANVSQPSTLEER